MDLLGIGLTGKSLTELERRIITDETPCAIVLFGRNVESPRQLRELVAEVKSIAKTPPLFMIDQEGGRVDRLRNLLPGLPSAEAFGEGDQPEEMSQWLGRIIGLSLRYFDIEIDLAPVVDIRGEPPTKGLERRTFGRDAATVTQLAGAFMRGLHGAGVAACPKHFPGLRKGSADPHYGATIVDIPLAELVADDLAPYRALGNEAASVMIGHGIYPQIDDPDLPASLSHRIATRLLREEAGFNGLAISDDMEMHAVSDLGSYEEIADRALKAGNDIILFCSHTERVPDLQRYLADKARGDAEFRARFEEAGARAEAFRVHCARLRANAPPPLATFDELTAELTKFLEAFQDTRPTREIYLPESERRKLDRTPGTGRTGREEWT